MMEFIRIKGKVYKRCEESLTTLFMFEKWYSKIGKGAKGGWKKKIMWLTE